MLKVLLATAVLLPEAAGYAELFDGDNYDGTSFRCHVHRRYLEGDLQGLNNKASSLRIQDGFMATVADKTDGTGASEVFIANAGSVLEVQLPQRLNNKISFVRVVPWRNPGKKGWAGGGGGQVHATWHYNWGKGARTTNGNEYVPMQWGKWGQPGSDAPLYRQQGITHLLGFNEPDSKEQANLGVEKALEIWPKLTAAGLRLGSPGTTDGGAWWLTSFIDKADARGLRVDFVAVHFYRGGMTPTQAFWWLAGWHDRTGRNLWVTEFNNGATWTCCKPTQGDNAWWINTFIGKLERAYFIERYSVYNWLGSARAMVHKNTLTPAGKKYKEKQTTAAVEATHYFYIANKTGKRLHVSGNQLVLEAGGGTEALWSMDRVGRFFHLRHKSSGRYVAVAGEAAQLVANTQTGATTRWRRKVAGEQWFFLISRQTQRRLHSGGSGPVVSTVPETWDGPATQWQFQYIRAVGVDNRRYISLKRVAGEKCVRVPNGKENDGLTEAACNGKDLKMMWLEIPVPQGLMLQGAFSEWCITVPNSSTQVGVQLILSSCSEEPNQVFNWHNGNQLRVQHSGMCLGGSDDGSNIVLQHCGEGPRDHFVKQ